MTAVVLAGGESRRMGKDKAFVTLGGIPLIERVLHVVRPIFKKTIVVTSRPEKFLGLGVPVHGDEVSGMGVLGGIYTGLLRAQTRYIFVFSCDMPFLNGDLVRFMKEKYSCYDIVIAKRDHILETLHAVYSKECIGPIEDHLRNGDRKIINFFPEVRLRIIKKEDFSSIDPEGLSFFNVNTPEDLRIAEQLLSG